MEEHRSSWLEGLGADLTHAVRSFATTPGFTAVAVLTLALGIGATTTIFSAVHAVIIKPLPYADDPERLVRIIAWLPGSGNGDGGPRRTTIGFTPAEIQELRSRTRSLSHAGTVGPTLMALSGREEAARLEGAVVSASVFPMLGMRPVVGRTILPEDEAAEHGVVVLSHDTWQRHFAGDPRVIGHTVSFQTVLGPRARRQVTVVGVMPPEFAFPTAQTQFWMPAHARPGETAVLRGPLLGRLAPGIQIEAALAEIAPIVRAIRGHAKDVTYELVREQDEVAAPVRPALLLLIAGAAAMLAIACANISALLLARALGRQREFAVRTALGASRGRLVRMALCEALALSVLGAITGLALAYAGVRALRALAFTLPRIDLGAALAFPRLQEVAIDPAVLGFAIVTSIAAAVVFGIAPAARQSAVSPLDSLKRSIIGTARPLTGRGLLVIAEIALAMMLATGGALLVRSFATLAAINPGYDARNVLTFQVNLPVDRYDDGRLVEFAERLVGELRAVPGVRTAAYANQIPLVKLTDSFMLRRTPRALAISAGERADARLVSREYLDAMGIRVIAGRGFRESDARGQPRVLVINESLARRDFADSDPLHRPVYFGTDPLPWHIVGVVADVRQFALDRPSEPQFFVDVRQRAGAGPLFPLGAYYVVRVTGDPIAVVPRLREIAHRLDPQAALFNVASMDTLLANSISRPRSYAVVLGVFASIGVVLAAAGVYGLLTFVVASRTRELGVRMALGAGHRDILREVTWQGLRLAAVGIVLGSATAVALTRYFRALLFGIEPLDPATFAFAATLLAAVATVACGVPAYRASRVNPIEALRAE